MLRYPIPAARVRVEETILRSRFITTLTPAPTVDAAKSFIAEIRSEFSDASHNCYAYLVGPPGSTAQVGMSDDGEPGGTAGRPMLAILAGGHVGDVAAVVTRYFGGTKLGTGGLVRAYSGGVRYALSKLDLVEKVKMVVLLARGPYSWITPLARLLPSYEATIAGQDYAADVAWRIRVPADRAEELIAAIIDRSHSALEIAYWLPE